MKGPLVVFLVVVLVVVPRIAQFRAPTVHPAMRQPYPSPFENILTPEEHHRRQNTRK
jgi:hypothetical protein